MKKNYYFALIFLFAFCGNTTAQTAFDFVGGGGFGFVAVPGPTVPPTPINHTVDYLPISNYHFFNPYYYNPAMAGIDDKKTLSTDWNRQDENSFLVSYEQPVSFINSAIGMYYSYTSDDYRSMRSYGLAYNYGFNFKDKAKLKLGFQYSQINIAINSFLLGSVESEKEWYNIPSMDVGMAFQIKNLRLGVAIQNLFPVQIITADEVVTFTNVSFKERQMNISVANTFELSEKWDWSLATLFRSNDIYDFSSYVSFGKKYFVGTTFRTVVDHHWVGFVGAKFKEKMNLQFSFNSQKELEGKRFIETLVQYQF